MRVDIIEIVEVVSFAMPDIITTYLIGLFIRRSHLLYNISLRQGAPFTMVPAPMLFPLFVLFVVGPLPASAQNTTAQCRKEFDWVR